jgi:hypothetical protein
LELTRERRAPSVHFRTFRSFSRARQIHQALVRSTPKQTFQRSAVVTHVSDGPTAQVAVAGGCLGILVNGDDDRLHVLIAPTLSRGEAARFLKSLEKGRGALFRRRTISFRSRSHAINSFDFNCGKQTEREQCALPAS